jgi:hypothetical protein
LHIYYISYNVNPGLINHGLLITPPIVIIWYLNGTLPINQPRGLLIQGWHYTWMSIIWSISASINQYLQQSTCWAHSMCRQIFGGSYNHNWPLHYV